VPRALALGVEMPFLFAYERNLGAVRQDGVHLELRRSDHEIDVDVADVGRRVGLAVERIREAHPVGDVTGRVLVEERVEEKRPGLADTRLVRDQRELTEPIGVLVRRKLAADEVRPLLRVDPDDPAVLEGELEPTEDLAVEGERLARADRPFGTPRVRSGEDLLRRQVRYVVDAAGGAEESASPARRGKQPDREIRAGPAVPKRVRA